MCHWNDVPVSRSLYLLTKGPRSRHNPPVYKFLWPERRFRLGSWNYEKSRTYTKDKDYTSSGDFKPRSPFVFLVSTGKFSSQRKGRTKDHGGCSWDPVNSRPTFSPRRLLVWCKRGVRFDIEVRRVSTPFFSKLDFLYTYLRRRLEVTSEFVNFFWVSQPFNTLDRFPRWRNVLFLCKTKELHVYLCLHPFSFDTV